VGEKLKNCTSLLATLLLPGRIFTGHGNLTIGTFKTIFLVILIICRTKQTTNKPHIFKDIEVNTAGWVTE